MTERLTDEEIEAIAREDRDLAIFMLKAEVAALRADVERLRGALKVALHYVECDEREHGFVISQAETIRAALGAS